MEDEANELVRLQEKTIDLMEAAIRTARHRPESASVVAGWARDAALELMRCATGGKSEPLQLQPEPTVEGEG
jgi:hypothetical protein